MAFDNEGEKEKRSQRRERDVADKVVQTVTSIDSLQGLKVAGQVKIGGYESIQLKTKILVFVSCLRIEAVPRGSLVRGTAAPAQSKVHPRQPKLWRA